MRYPLPLGPILPPGLQQELDPSAAQIQHTWPALTSPLCVAGHRGSLRGMDRRAGITSSGVLEKAWISS
jgi:hypothetical protein